MSGLRVERAQGGAHPRRRPRPKAVRARFVGTVPSLLADLERQYLDRLMLTRDATEGISAFIERRSPLWRDA